MDENEDKIVGGDIVNDISERPFQVALETDFGFQFCGMYSSLIRPSKVFGGLMISLLI